MTSCARNDVVTKRATNTPVQPPCIPAGSQTRLGNRTPPTGTTNRGLTALTRVKPQANLQARECAMQQVKKVCAGARGTRSVQKTASAGMCTVHKTGTVAGSQETPAPSHTP